MASGVAFVGHAGASKGSLHPVGSGFSAHGELREQRSWQGRSDLRLGASAIATLAAGVITTGRRSGRAGRCQLAASQAASYDTLDDLMATGPDRAKALRGEIKSTLKWKPRKPLEVVPEEVAKGKYAKEIEIGMTAMEMMCHTLTMSTLMLEESKDKSTVGLHGISLEAKFVRQGPAGKVTTMPEACATASMMRTLQEHFPGDPVLSSEDADVLRRDEAFAGTVAQFLRGYGIEEDADPIKVSLWHQHSRSYPEDAASPPHRYWVWKPADSQRDYRTAKQYCCTLCLMEDNEPVVSFMGCPCLAFDHPSRTTSHGLGVNIFWAVKGQGSYAQLLILDRDAGVYNGWHGLKNRSMKLKVEEKIKRFNDGLYDHLPTNQLRITIGDRLQEWVLVDAERVGNILGSQYPKFHMSNSAVKYAWLARGDEDCCWIFNTGLYDKKATEHMVDHAAGVLIAAESGAAVSDLDGKPIDWSTGPFLKNNRGVVATDPSTVPLLGLIRAVEKATVSSQADYEFRCEKRKEQAHMLAAVFEGCAQFAETDEERKGAEILRVRGLEMLKNDEEMDRITQEAIHRETPFLGEGPSSAGDPFASGSFPASSRP